AAVGTVRATAATRRVAGIGAGARFAAERAVLAVGEDVAAVASADDAAAAAVAVGGGIELSVEIDPVDADDRERVSAVDSDQAVASDQAADDERLHPEHADVVGHAEIDAAVDADAAAAPGDVVDADRSRFGVDVGDDDVVVVLVLEPADVRQI